MRRRTDHIVVHCSATPPSSDIGADEIEDWHTQPKPMGNGWSKIGYAAVVRRDGQIEFGHHFDEAGIHVRGWNYKTVGICLVGGVNEQGQPENNFTDAQFESARALIAVLKLAYPGATVVGHRDLSPDLNGDGLITSDEWLKACPSFEVSEVLA